MPISAAARETDSSCSYEVVIKNQEMVFPLCLDSYIPVDDSCSQLRISTSLLPGANLNFYCSLKRIWHFKGITCDSLLTDSNRIKVLTESDQDGNVARIVVIIRPESDSLVSSIDINKQKDIKVLQPDKPEEQTFSIDQVSFICEENTIRSKTVVREFTRPAGYMRRGQELNYPELKMFHYGKAIRLPTAKSLQNLKEEQEYHIVHPKKLEYE